MRAYEYKSEFSTNIFHAKDYIILYLVSYNHKLSGSQSFKKKIATFGDSKEGDSKFTRVISNVDES